MEDTVIMKIIAFTIFGIFASIGGCTATINYQDNSAIVDMVKNGSDPIDARCAIRGNESSGTVCVVRASKK